MASGENRIVVDWDGTLVPQEWPDHPPLTAEAVTFLETLLHEGWEVVVYSTRLAPFDVDEMTRLPMTKVLEERAYIRKALDSEGLEAVKVWTKPWKPGARWYIDDKAIPFRGSWDDVLKVVESDLENHWRKVTFWNAKYPPTAEKIAPAEMWRAAYLEMWTLVQRQRGIIQEAVKKGLGWRAEREALREALREASVALDEAGCQVAASQAHRALQRDES